jgi:peptidyl-tRNA hydrolase
MGVGKLAAQVGHATLGLYYRTKKSKEVCFGTQIDAMRF